MREIDLKPLPDDKRCSCGEPTLTLARDMTEHTPVRFVSTEYGDAWRVQDAPHMENIDGECTVRLFCPSCGEYFAVPSELED